MPTPLDSPLVSPLVGTQPSTDQIQDLINTAARAGTGTVAAVKSAIEEQLAIAAKAAQSATTTIASSIASKLQAASNASAGVQNGLDTAILGQLGSAVAMGSQVPGFQPPTVQNLANAFNLPAPPQPPAIPATIQAAGQVFSPGGGGQGGEIVPIKTPSNCLHAKWKLPDGTFAVAQWTPGVTEPPQAPSSWQLYDGPKSCDYPLLPDLPDPTPQPPPPLPVVPKPLQPVDLPPPATLPKPPPAPNAPCPSGVSGGTARYSMTATIQGVTLPVARYSTTTWVGWCLPGYFAPYKSGNDWIVPVWVKDAQKMYACLFSGNPASAYFDYVILAYPEGSGSKAYQATEGLRLGDVYAIEWLDDGGPGIDPTEPKPPTGPTYPGQPPSTPPSPYPPISGNPIVNNPIGGFPIVNNPTPGGGGTPTGYGGGTPIQSAPIINNPVGGGGGYPPSPTPGGPTPSPPSPSPPSPVPPSPSPPSPQPPSPYPPTPGPPPSPYPPYPPSPPPPPYPSPPSPYPPIDGAPIINNPVGGSGGGGTLCQVERPPASGNVYVTCPMPEPPAEPGGPGGGEPCPPCPGDGSGTATLPKWPTTDFSLPPWPTFCDLNFNKVIDSITSAFVPGKPFDILQLVGARDANGNPDPNNWLSQFLAKFPQDVVSGIALMCDEFSSLIKLDVAIGGTPVLAFLAPGLLRMLAQAVHHFTGIRSEGIEHKVDYWFNYLSPDLMPEVGEFNKMRLARVITAKQWRAGVRANNRCEKWQKLVMDAERERVDYAELWRLDKLGLLEGGISQEDTLSYGFRKQSDIDDYQNAMLQWPGFEEALQWGVKGVTDDEYAAEMGLDEGLDEVMDEELKRYAAAHGTLGDLLARRWRAHWDLPSVEFALDAFHRLRPGRVEPELVLTPEQVNGLLAANGIPAGYQDRYIELSRPKITRREMSVLYKMGAISKQEVVERLRDIGYVESFGKSIADSFQLQKVSQLANMPESRAYVKGGLNTDELNPVLKQYGASDEDAKLVYERLHREIKAASQEKIVDSFHKRFLAGDIPINLLVGVLTQNGVELETANMWGQQWIAEFLAKEKHVEAGQLVTWYTSGLIAKPDLITRLGRLGYKAEDISGIVALADSKVAESVAKTIMAKKKADDKAKMQIAKQSAQEAKQATAALRASERLANAVNKITIELQIHEKITTEDAHKKVTDAIEKYRQLEGSSDAGATDFIKNAWAIHSKKGAPTWEEVVDDYIASLKQKQADKANKG